MIFKRNSLFVRALCTCRGFGFIAVEACRVENDCMTWVRIYCYNPIARRGF